MGSGQKFKGLSPEAAEMMILAFFNGLDLDFFLPWFIFSFFFGVIFGDPGSFSGESSSEAGSFELFRAPGLFFLGTTLFRLDDLARDEVEADIGLEGPERIGELGLGLVCFTEPKDKERRDGDTGLIGEPESCGELGLDDCAKDELGRELGQL